MMMVNHASTIALVALPAAVDGFRSGWTLAIGASWSVVAIAILR
jgi:ABC-type nitrate/sulfonate/bicarbonate transport system permease component